MTALAQTFDASQVEPATPFEVLPPGKYQAQIVASEMRDTKSGNGQYLWLEFDILSGEFAGRKTWTNLNLVNQNPQAAEIAQRNLSAICRAAGVMQVSDSEQLHCKPMTITIKVRPGGPDKQGIVREASNNIVGYEPANGKAAPSAAPQSHVGSFSAPAPIAATKQATPPWRRNAAA